MSRTELIRLLIFNTYNGYRGSLHGLESSKYEYYKNFKIGDTVLEISSMFYTRDDLSRIGELISTTQDLRHGNKYVIKLLTDGSKVSWENCEFIKVQNSILK